MRFRARSLHGSRLIMLSAVLIAVGLAGPTAVGALYGVDLPKLPRTSDRLHLFVHHTDDNDGDFEAGIARHANKC